MKKNLFCVEDRVKISEQITTYFKCLIYLVYIKHKALRDVNVLNIGNI